MLDAIPYDDRSLLVVQLFKGCRRCYEGLGRPVVDQFVNLLFHYEHLRRVACSACCTKHTASVSWTFFWVLYLGASKYLTAKRNKKSSIALRTGSFW